MGSRSGWSTGMSLASKGQTATAGLEVLHSCSRLLRPSPVGASPGERLVRARLAEDTTVELGPDAVLMGARGTADLAGGVAVLRQLGQARPEARIDIPLQHFRGGV